MTDITVRDQPRSTIVFCWMVAVTMLLAGAIGFSRQALGSARKPTHAVAWGSLGFTAYAASLLCPVGGGKGDPLGLGRRRFNPWTLLLYGTAFGLTTLTRAQPERGTSAEISLPRALRALWLVAVGVTLWVLGYSIGPGRAALRFGNKMMAALSAWFAPEVRSRLAAWIVYAIGTAARIATAATTGLFGYVWNVQSAVTTASNYWLFAVYLTFGTRKRSPRSSS